MIRGSARGRSGGFTLLEVLLALALTVLLTGAVFSFLDTLARRRDELARTASKARELGTLLDRIEADLATAIVGDGRGGVGIRGGTSELSVLTRRVVANGATAVGSEPPAQAGELSRARYVFDGAYGAVRAGRGAPGGDVAATEVVAGGVRAMRVRYFVGRAWRGEFDSEKENTLPAAIEVALWSAQTGEGGSELSEVKGEPDRVRTIVIPDGPSAAWKEER